MPKTIEVKLSIGGIDRAIRELNQYKRSLKPKQELMLALIGDLGTDIIREEIRNFPKPAVEDGDLLQGIYADHNIRMNDLRLISSAYHSMFVEYGTGHKGKTTKKHPEQPGFWDHDLGDYGTEGWMYRDGGRYRWTMGMTSRPFMYNSAQRLKEEIPELAKEVFSD